MFNIAILNIIYIILFSMICMYLHYRILFLIKYINKELTSQYKFNEELLEILKNHEHIKIDPILKAAKNLDLKKNN